MKTESIYKKSKKRNSSIEKILEEEKAIPEESESPRAMH